MVRRQDIEKSKVFQNKQIKQNQKQKQKTKNKKQKNKKTKKQKNKKTKKTKKNKKNKKKTKKQKNKKQKTKNNLCIIVTIFSQDIRGHKHRSTNIFCHHNSRRNLSCKTHVSNYHIIDIILISQKNILWIIFLFVRKI